MSNDFRIVVLLSGRGSNFKSLLEAAQHYKIVRVISNNADAGGLAIATDAGIPTRVVSRQAHPTLAAQKAEILRVAASAAPDLVVLAGFMQIIAPDFLAEFPRRVINIHPALLPKFAGLDTHARAISAGETEHGCTVHLVDSGIDTGETIAQATVPVAPDDTAETLGARVLVREHALFPWVVTTIARGDIALGTTPVTFSAAAREGAKARGFRLPPSR